MHGLRITGMGVACDLSVFGRHVISGELPLCSFWLSVVELMVYRMFLISFSLNFFFMLLLCLWFSLDESCLYISSR